MKIWLGLSRRMVGGIGLAERGRWEPALPGRGGIENLPAVGPVPTGRLSVNQNEHAQKPRRHCDVIANGSDDLRHGLVLAVPMPDIIRERVFVLTMSMLFGAFCLTL